MLFGPATEAGTLIAACDHLGTVLVWLVTATANDLHSAQRLEVRAQDGPVQLAWADRSQSLLAVARRTALEVYTLVGSQALRPVFICQPNGTANAGIQTLAFSARGGSGLPDGYNLCALGLSDGRVCVYHVRDPRHAESFDKPVYSWHPHVDTVASLVFCTAAPAALPSGPSTSCDHPVLITANSTNRCGIS